MSDFNAVWDATPATGGFGDQVKPPAGWVGELSIPDTKMANKDGETYIVVEYRSADGQYEWSDFKYVTKNGQPHEGRIKSVKILLSSLGYPEVAGPALGSVLKSLVGQRFTAETVASGSFAPDGSEYINTKILGSIAANVGPAPQQVAQAAAAAPAPTAAPVPQQVPWDQPAQVAPAAEPVNAIVGG